MRVLFSYEGAFSEANWKASSYVCTLLNDLELWTDRVVVVLNADSFNCVIGLNKTMSSIDDHISEGLWIDHGCGYD
jgi:hypothetical protein